MVTATVSTAQIVRQILKAAGLVALVTDEPLPTDGTPICYVSSMPDETDSAVLIKDTLGLNFGRSQRSRTLIHAGVKLWIRQPTFPPAVNYAQAIAIYFDNFPPQSAVSIPNDPSSPHCVQSIYRVNTLVDLGEEVGKRRQLWTLNARVAYGEEEPVKG